MNHVSLGIVGGPIWLLILALLAGFGLAVWTYRHTVPQTTNSRRRILITLRSVALALLLFAIFEPIFSNTTFESFRPSIALVLDRSQSMLLGSERSNSDSAKTRLAALKSSVRAIFSQEMLLDSSRVVGYGVGDRTEHLPLPSGIDSLHADASATDLSSIFKKIREDAVGKNLQAIVLYTDGAFTAGASPIYAAQDLGVPIYAIGLGDSSEVRDIAVSELFTNEVGTVGVGQPVDAVIHAAGVRSGERVTVGLYAEGQLIEEKSLSLVEGTSDQSVSFTFTPKIEGMAKLSVRASKIDGEITEKNNLRLQFVNVLKNKFKVTLIAGAPSSDVSFIKAHFAENPSLEFRTFIQKEGADFYEGQLTADKIIDADLIVLVGFPIASSSEATLQVIRDVLTKGAKPLLFVPSHTLDVSKLSELEEVLPFKASGLRSSTNEIKVSAAVSPQAAADPVLRIPTSDKDIFTWEGLAPLFKTETHFEARPESSVLLEATLQGVKLQEPLLLSRRIGASREIALTGYGLWQWKLSTFGREQAYLAESHSQDSTKLHAESALDVLLGNAVRWLTTRDENKRVRIEPERKFYEAAERISFVGEVYDASYLPVEKATVTLKLTGGTLSTPLELTLAAIGNGRYTAQLPAGLAAGDYSYSGIASLDGKQLGADAGRFNVGEFNVEFAEPRMRSDLLRELAARTGGKFYTPETAGNLLRDIESSKQFAPKHVENTHEFALWNAWPLLVAALACLAAEWLMRKRLGML